MTWAKLHGESERLASLASEAMRRGRPALAKANYKLAARAETDALASLDPGKPRTSGITAVSAVALWFKSGNLKEAESLAHRAFVMEGMPAFALDELRSLLQVIWREQATITSTAKVSTDVEQYLRERLEATDDGRLLIQSNNGDGPVVGVMLTVDEYELLSGAALLARNPDRLTDALARLSNGEQITFAEIFAGGR